MKLDNRDLQECDDRVHQGKMDAITTIQNLINDVVSGDSSTATASACSLLTDIICIRADELWRTAVQQAIAEGPEFADTDVAVGFLQDAIAPRLSRLADCEVNGIPVPYLNTVINTLLLSACGKIVHAAILADEDNDVEEFCDLHGVSADLLAQHDPAEERNYRLAICQHYGLDHDRDGYVICTPEQRKAAQDLGVDSMIFRDADAGLDGDRCEIPDELLHSGQGGAAFLGDDAAAFLNPEQTRSMGDGKLFSIGAVPPGMYESDAQERRVPRRGVAG